MKKLNTLELFVGCGGLLDGFEQSGYYNTVASVEWQKHACDTLVNRLKNKYKYVDAENRVLHFDIQRTEELINGWEHDKDYGSNHGLNQLINNRDIDVIVGGPPCQAYSLAGRIQDKDGMRNDYRNYLFESYLEVVKVYKPKIIVFENVEGMLSAMPDGESIIDKIRKGFNEYGFDIIDDIREEALLDLTKFGVPQKRKRVILVGLNRKYFGNKGENQKTLQYFYNVILNNYRTETIPNVSDAIADLPKLYPSQEDYRVGSRKYSHLPNITEINWHIPRYHNRRDIDIFKILAHDIATGENKYQNIEALKKLYTEKTGKISNVHKYYVLRWDQPSNTIPAHLKKDGLRHIHPDPEQARSITVREAARLQTFDDDFEFIGSMVQNYEMIGNAVPPKFSGKLASAIYDLLFEKGMA
ncbi:DNA cytosine methyltransferase [Bacillus cereus]|uniref:DNA cytosine methyltransferase n=1 Tax=Bacillus cereus TaxID=1396 RepID=UPI001427DC4F|nr:DNA cytosine methyltransferase [Bacillus cereus]MBF8117005.1 DNA cytosine methyltransferase [Bacillus cereus]NIL13349.1 DNA cytosine methyltransferase [Bacillus cereus]NKW76664.1 DNA cytosine methyltransferase [Bacillus cereus]HDR6478581.1 DNA cytosine methyltransferase [Bacillus cereus]HDR8131748.1 DNA cytosine methyltransferase [Bacillus cereus]